MKIIKYDDKYLKQYKAIIKMLWDDIEISEITSLTNNHNQGKEFIFLAIDENDVIGFLNTSIRVDYVEGSNSDETGYIEGIFVKEEYRKQQVAKKMLEEALKYFQTKNITEVGSDTHVDNLLSSKFHRKVGFKEVEVNRHYILKIK
jgi:aminoglycoside 6'-N-acetyltransferase I